MLIAKKTLGTVSIMGGIQFCHTEFAYSLAQMVQYSNEYVCAPGEIVHLDRAQLSYHSSARNELAQRMLGDWVLMLDTDHAFAPDLLYRMLRLFNYYKLDVLTGVYHMRIEPFLPLLYCWNDEKDGFQHLADWQTDVDIFQVDSAGAGCLMIRRSVIERIYEELNEEPFSITMPWSEDHSFFVRLRKLGIKAYAAPAIQCAHLRTQPITTDDYVDRQPFAQTKVAVNAFRQGVPV